MEQKICTCPETLAIATVPKQKWCDPYPLEEALYEGTIFPCLNLLFYKAPKSTEADRACPKPINDEERAREDLMKEIYTVSFALNDLTLYLDTHPDCKNGGQLYQELLKKRLDLLAEFAGRYYPLTHLSIVTGHSDEQNYSWAEGPLPWEGGRI